MGRAEPIYVTTIPRHDSDPAGIIRDIRFDNIDCYSEHGVFIGGCDKQVVEHISLRDVRVTLQKTSSWPGGQHDWRPAHSGEHNGLQDAADNGGISGFHFENVHHASVRGCEVRYANPENEIYQRGLHQVRCQDIRIETDSCSLPDPRG